jgi:flagellar basal body L-ring protein FlgH
MTLVCVALVGALGGCANLFGRLASIGQEPELSPIDNPVERPAYRPVSLPMPATQPEIYPANSLWRQGARSFFKDQRARAVGDVLTVEVTISDEASLTNETSRARANADGLSASAFFGYESKLGEIFPDAVDPDNLLELESEMSNLGRGDVQRNEEIKLNVAAVVVQGPAQRQSGDPGAAGGAGQLRGPRAVRGRGGAAGGHHAGQHHPARPDRRAPGRLWRPRPDHRRAAAALRRPGSGCDSALLSRRVSEV